MKHILYKDLQGVKWKDLIALTPKEIWIENIVILPWLVAAVTFAYFKLYWLAVPCSFMLFLTALRQAHNGFHNALGISRRLTDMSLHFLSVVMLSSMHAVKYNHLQHHRHCLGDKDHEGKAADMSALQAILYGPVHVISMHYFAVKHGSTKIRRQVLTDMSLIILLIVSSFVFDMQILYYHLIVMTIGECFSAFFAVWTVHHDCNEYMFARTMRHRFCNTLTYNMFFHLEHHLFPKVPTIKLPELAKRIDEAKPNLELKEVF